MTKRANIAVSAEVSGKTAKTTSASVNKGARGLSITKKAAADRKAESQIDLELVQRCQKGDDVAFGQLISRYQRKVFTIALGMVKTPDDAMDIAQEAFIKVHRYIGNFQGSSSFYTWLYRIIVNLCIDHLRRSGKFASVEFDERIYGSASRGGKEGVHSKGLDGDPSRNLGRKELAEHIQAAIDELPPYHRAVIVMREIEGMSYADMAKAMKVSKGTIMSRLHHARQKLQRSLKDYLQGELVVR
jgi:RNA polymerase sigma-70 factor (ECF subfamily)